MMKFKLARSLALTLAMSSMSLIGCAMEPADDSAIDGDTDKSGSAPAMTKFAFAQEKGTATPGNFYLAVEAEDDYSRLEIKDSQGKVIASSSDAIATSEQRTAITTGMNGGHTKVLELQRTAMLSTLGNNTIIVSVVKGSKKKDYTAKLETEVLVSGNVDTRIQIAPAIARTVDSNGLVEYKLTATSTEEFVDDMTASITWASAGTPRTSELEVAIGVPGEGVTPPTPIKFTAIVPDTYVAEFLAPGVITRVDFVFSKNDAQQAAASISAKTKLSISGFENTATPVAQ